MKLECGQRKHQNYIINQYGVAGRVTEAVDSQRINVSLWYLNYEEELLVLQFVLVCGAL